MHTTHTMYTTHTMHTTYAMHAQAEIDKMYADLNAAAPAGDRS